MWLLLLFIGVPILEIALFIQVGGAIGLWPTLLIVILTAIIGTTLMRIQGMQALTKLQRSLESGQDPVGPIAHGALILVSGILLLTPGFFTDATGFLLLIPAVRTKVIAWGASHIALHAVSFGTSRTTRTRRNPGNNSTIETDYEVLDGDEPSEPGNSGWTKRNS
ncbi:FxsA family protein [Amaricoccus tamworthensis]|uniref:FxsA family protein n=1 Tax=Amaricoccus tamworthensis TaxID=57002 RepID=UPI003C7BF6FC